MDPSTASSDDIVSRIEATLEPEALAPAPEQEVEAPEPAQPETDEDLPPEEAQDEEVETTDEEEAEPEAEDQEAETDEDGVDLSTEDFAGLLGVDEGVITLGDDGEVLIKTKVGDDIQNVGLKDLIKAHQTEKYVTQKSKEVSESKKAFEAEREAHIGEVTAKLNEAANLTQMFENQLMSEYNNVDWNALRATNPAEFAARRQEMSDKQGLLNQAKATLGEQARTLNAERQTEIDNLTKATREKEGEALLSAIPEWSDREVAKKEYSLIEDYAAERYGFTNDDFDNITDHRAILVLRDAMRYRQSKDKASAAVKKVKALPKMSAPGKNKQRKNPRAESAKANRIKLRKSGSVNDAAAALLSRM